MISKAREKIKSFYGFNDDVAEVKQGVEWLIKDAHFIFGSVNLKVGFFQSLYAFNAVTFNFLPGAVF